MKITSFSIQRKITTMMIYLILIGFGIFALTQLKVALTPDLDFPAVIIYTTYSGASPEDIENLVSRPIEEGVSSTENVEDITSQSQEGSSLVILEFTWGTDMDQAETDVRNNLDLVRDYLPDDANEPMVFAINPSMFPVMYVSLNSENLGPAELRRIAEDKVEPLIERIEGVASVTTMGGLQRQINIKLDPAMLAAHDVSAERIASTIQTGAGLTAAGSIETSSKKFNLRVYSEYRSVEQIGNIVVKTENGIPIHVKDIALVEDGYEEQTADVRINDGQGVALIINKQSDANTSQTAENVKKEIPEIENLLPQGTRLSIVYNQSEFINKSVNNLSSTVIIAFFITIAVIYFFLRNWRGSLIMAVSMPISVILTFGALMAADLTLNIISMAGLALAIGMLVDNSIVVLENTFRHRELGKSLVDAANYGASEVGMAITASTLTTLSVFLPVLFVPGITGQLFKDMVLTITFSLTVSLIVALTIVPLLSSLLLKTKEELLIAKKRTIDNKIEAMLSKLSNFYQKALNYSIYHKKVIILSILALAIGSFMLLPFMGGDFMPSTDQSFIQITMEEAAGSPLESLRETVLQCEKIIDEEVPELTNVLFQFGTQSGMGSINSSSTTISIILKLVPSDERDRTQFEIQDALRTRLNDVPGITYTIQSGGMMGNNESDIMVKLLGHDLEKSRLIAEEIESKIEKLDGFVDVRLNVQKKVPQLSVNLNQDMLNELNLTYLQVASMISTAIQGRTAAQYRESGDEYDVYVQLDKKFRQDRNAIENLVIPLSNGETIPLKQIGTVDEGLSQQKILRENQDRYIAVECNISGIDLTSATNKINEILSEMTIPSEFTVLIGGSAEDQQESNFYLMIALIVAIALVYMVMASQFESLLDPFIIMFTVPLSLIGVILFLFITGTSISVMAMVGMVMLVGIAVNNGIVLVDYINQLRQQGKSLYEAVEEGGIVRLRPVLMTALTTILGMVPLAMEFGAGSEMWSPLARTVIGGLTVTTVLTLILIPVIYIIFEEWGAKVKKRFFTKS